MKVCKRACIRKKSSMGNTLLEFGRPGAAYSYCSAPD